MNPIKGGVITTPFEEIRPRSIQEKLKSGKKLSAEDEKIKHVHGALDIAPRGDSRIYAPCDGIIFGYIARRVPEDSKQGKRYWPQQPMIRGKRFPFCNYFYDMYGGVIVLKETDHNRNVINTHLICHSFMNQLFNLSILKNCDKSPIEEKEICRYPIFAWYTGELFVRQGEAIGFVGSAGCSTGNHIHWEIHPSQKWIKHENRIHPEKYM